jgi:hypothetical protein
MIEKFYAAHIKNRLDAAAINVVRPKPKPMVRKMPTVHQVDDTELYGQA